MVCWINTCNANLETKAKAIKETWGKRCDVLLFVADQTNNSFPTIGFNTTEGKLRMVPRIFKAFDYVYRHHLDDGDWFLRSDDDAYVIMENLRYMLTSYNAAEKWYLGEAYDFGPKQGFNSGGASFVLSKAALSALYMRAAGECTNEYKTVGRDDIELGRCLYHLGVNISDTRDILNGSRFHPYRPVQHLNGTFCVVNGREFMKYGCTKVSGENNNDDNKNSNNNNNSNNDTTTTTKNNNGVHVANEVIPYKNERGLSTYLVKCVCAV